MIGPTGGGGDSPAVEADVASVGDGGSVDEEAREPAALDGESVAAAAVPDDESGAMAADPDGERGAMEADPDGKSGVVAAELAAMAVVPRGCRGGAPRAGSARRRRGPVTRGQAGAADAGVEATN